VRRPDWNATDRVRLLEEKFVGGRKWEKYQTELGTFWLPAPGKHLLHGLVWEMTVQVLYEGDGVVIRPGDTVIDAGAHVGVFSRYALRQGAGRVIAIEPDPTNIACLEANLAPEIAAGKVVVVKAGVWHQRGYLTLLNSDEDSAKHSFVAELSHSSSIAGLPVLTLDEIVEQLKLARVDFIKMDIEGSERFALQGAKQTISRFRPKMAICAYHVGDDVVVIPSVVRMIQPTYQIHAKDLEPVRILGTRRKELRPKVMLFH